MARLPRPHLVRAPVRVSARALASALLAVAAFGPLVACGGADGPPLSAQAAQGQDIMRDRGCAACHGRNGGGGVGPSWVGLWGTTQDLESGEQVLVDADYVRRSIAEPAADLVAGFNVTMPDNNLTDDEIDAVVAYIEALGQ